jgi:ATP-dependent Lhr-like helicase
MSVIPPYSPITRSELSSRSSLPKEAFAEALKKLYAGLFVIRDSKNRYLITKSSEMPVADARRKVLRRIIENLGLITAEALSAYVKHEFKMTELRGYLKQWEQDGWLVKGYLVEGSDALYWMIKEDLPKVMSMDFKGRIVLSPTDTLTQYLSQEIREKFNIGACFVVLENTEMAGAFKATTRGGTLTVTQMVGPKVDDVIRDFARRWGMKVEYSDKEAPPPTDEWEIITWYEKQHGAKPGDKEGGEPAEEEEEEEDAG